MATNLQNQVDGLLVDAHVQDDAVNSKRTFLIGNRRTLEKVWTFIINESDPNLHNANFNDKEIQGLRTLSSMRHTAAMNEENKCRSKVINGVTIVYALIITSIAFGLSFGMPENVTTTE
eukprot:TRINITY_DN5300_c0_g1_i1.p1 TRINITY_DN5300_c0_g1~~TRINITY_DN5300_c0_g1_i1.p1  ORF type:complete len:119 (+),score=5.69 TRINITY_DN5300_c0_g1_i1:117-473(+)